MDQLNSSAEKSSKSRQSDIALDKRKSPKKLPKFEMSAVDEPEEHELEIERKIVNKNRNLDISTVVGNAMECNENEGNRGCNEGGGVAWSI
ncbi:conserved hypothetical protein [Ricinus communis]|uniref:Uncharacterized protein n=1 Tax=Ricinus communis TaxID=3988 RepID=B9RR21_RICCO|nr:conserved hypothetical protein [Ricinus communis]